MLDVYISALPSCEPTGILVPKERDDEVRAAGSETVRREKYFVWRLLESALWSSLGVTLDEAGLYKSASGKWMSRVCEISLTHSKGLIAVAISSMPVGIDVEQMIEPRARRFAERILTDAEFVRYNMLGDNEQNVYLTECWTRKEAVFKMENSDAFIPNAYESENGNTACRRLEHGGKEYVLAVASECIDSLEYKQGL